MSNLTGQSIGRYHILEQLGEGGMATVYKAYDTRLERNVAFKVLRTDLFGQAVLEQVLKRFEREAKSLAKLKHSNIVNILDYGEHEGTPYLVMEYLPGGTLKQKLGHLIPWQEAIQTLLHVARGLSYAHQHGVIHRDVKPANILIDENNVPVLTDFGIAKLLEGTDGHTLTGSGVGIGTPEYMAPEQGIGASTIDARADIYSLGIVLYEMVTGRKPYIADTPMAVVLKQITDPLPRPTKFVPDLPEGVERILLKALAKEPNDRYENMNALIATMENVLAKGPTVPVQPTPAQEVRQVDLQTIEVSTLTMTTPTREVEKKERARPRLSPKVVIAVVGALAIILVIIFGVPWVKQQYSEIPETTSTVEQTAPVISTFTLLPPTSTLEPSPSPILTRTPLPTATNTPVPVWVTDFADPILLAITEHAPDFQDDFSTKAGGWIKGEWCADWRLKFVDGEMVVTDCRVEREMWHTDFVIKMDARFLPGSSTDSRWRFYYRLPGVNYLFDFGYSGDVTVGFEGLGSPAEYTMLQNVINPGQNVNHILIIVKDQAVALFVNDLPLYYGVLKPIWKTGGMQWSGGNSVAYDNFKIWDITDLEIP